MPGLRFAIPVQLLAHVVRKAVFVSADPIDVKEQRTRSAHEEVCRDGSHFFLDPVIHFCQYMDRNAAFCCFIF